MPQLRILLTEDNEGDVIITKELLKGSRYTNELHVCPDGASAISFLDNSYISTSPINLIILDRNLPDIDGFEILAHIKKSSKWAQVPVFMFTSSLFEAETFFDKEYQPDYFLQKPLNIGLFDKIISSVLIDY